MPLPRVALGLEVAAGDGCVAPPLAPTLVRLVATLAALAMATGTHQVLLGGDHISKITDAMIGAAASTLAASMNQSEIEGGCLMPEITRLWEVCGTVASAVAHQAVADGVAPGDMDVDKAINAMRWTPRYPVLTKS